MTHRDWSPWIALSRERRSVRVATTASFDAHVHALQWRSMTAPP